jgi:hypothetical protein
MIRVPAGRRTQEGRIVVKKKKAARKASKKAARKAAGKKASSRKSTRKPARKTARRAAPKKTARAATRKAAGTYAFSSRPASPRKAGLPKSPAVPMAAGAASAGEDYGRESWREEELSAAELDADAPELDELEAELEEPEPGGADDEAEW